MCRCLGALVSEPANQTVRRLVRQAGLAPDDHWRVLTPSHVSVNLKSIVGIGRLDRRVGSRRFVRLIRPQAIDVQFAADFRDARRAGVDWRCHERIRQTLSVVRRVFARSLRMTSTPFGTFSIGHCPARWRRADDIAGIDAVVAAASVCSRAIPICGSP